MWRAVKGLTAALAVLMLLVLGLPGMIAVALERWGPGLLEQNGFGPTRVEVEEIGWSGVALARTSIGDLEIEHASLQWSARGLLARRLDRATVRGIRCRVERIPAGWSVCGNELDMGEESDEVGRGFSLRDSWLPRAIHAEDLVFVTTVGGDPWRIEAHGAADLTNDWQGDLEFQAGPVGPLRDAPEASSDPGLRGSLELASPRVDAHLVGRFPRELLELFGMAGVDSVDAELRAHAELGGPIFNQTPLVDSVAFAELHATVVAVIDPVLEIERARAVVDATYRDGALSVDVGQAALVRADQSTLPFRAGLDMAWDAEPGAAAQAAFSMFADAWEFPDGTGSIAIQGKGAISTDAAQMDVHLEGAVMGSGRPDAVPSGRIAGDFEIEWDGRRLGVHTGGRCLSLEVDAGDLAGAARLWEDASLCVKSPAAGPLVVESDADGDTSLAGTIEIEPFELEVGPLRGEAWWSGTTPTVRVEAVREAEEIRAQVVASGGEFALPFADVALAGIEAPVAARWTPSGSEFSGPFSVSRLRIGRQNPVVAELAVEGQISGGPDSATFGFDARSPQGARLRGSGAHSLVDGKGSVSFELAPVRFGETGVDFAALIPALAEVLEVEAGELEGAGTLQWGEQLRPDIQVFVRRAAVGVGSTRAKGLQASARLVGFDPLETAPDQDLVFSRVELAPDLVLEEGALQWALAGPDDLVIREGRFRLAGGEVRIEGTLDLSGRADQGLTFEADDLDIASLLALAPVEGLDISGWLTGRFELALVSGRPVLRGARFQAPGGGRLRYAPTGSAAAIAGTGSQGEILMEALRDFHYESLEVQASGQLDEGAEMRVLLKGRNPNFQDGRPVHLTVNISSAFAEAVRQLPVFSDLLDRLAARAGQDVEDRRDDNASD